MKFEVDEKLVEPVIREQISAAIVAQLGDTTELLTEMVNLTLKQKVDKDGKVDSYSSYNKFTLVEALAGKAIREAAREAIEAIIEQQKPQIEAAVRDYLSRAPKRTAAAIVNAFCDSATTKYRMSVEFKGVEDD